MPSLGLLYMASYLRSKEISVILLDAEGRCMNHEETVKFILSNNPKTVGITTTTTSILSAVSIAVSLKKISSDIKIILGGPHVTALPNETMSSFKDIDACVLGDGEINFAKLITNILSGKYLSDGIDGLIYRNGDEIKLKSKKGYLENLDSLPFPAWDMLNGFPSIYRPPFHSYRRLPLANIVTARGCPFACSFCDRSVFGGKIHSHSVEYIVEMIEYLVKDFGIKEISIKDDMFIISKERVHQFCDQLLKKNLNIQWSCNARVNFISDDILKEIKGAGCWMVSYGIESGSPLMLKKMMKGISKEQVMTALKLTRKNDIVSKGFFMIGMPGETEKTIQETLDFIKDLPLDELNINFFTPFPGSRLYQEVLAEGFKPDYSRMNMLDTVYVPKELTEEKLRSYQKKIIYVFYLKFSKLVLYLRRAFQDMDEFKRNLRMLKMFMKVIYSSLKREAKRS